VNYLALTALHHYGTVDLNSDPTAAAAAAGIIVGGSRKKKAQAIEEYQRILEEQKLQQQRALGLYKALRTNLLRTVLGQYHETGHFWEHYDDVSGKGTRGHPFSGWTTLILNIMAELY
jgi:hypothetical protein